ncbi:predicted coiled-coil protein [Kipferlia bialata]|uniref:Predicted coiled-coil protein n=1 Tax=Kipferlia bialata TaxID=797122 RepID=A0A9K3GP51_9EUKA|nr:predicted coiled-coil protein [Kipferlia bialata]|eukprot:g13812.t1
MSASFSNLTRQELYTIVTQLQTAVEELSVRIEKVKKDNRHLSKENTLLQSYIGNLIAKVGVLECVVVWHLFDTITCPSLLMSVWVF